VLETKIHVGVGWKPFISSGKAPFPPALVLKEACKHPFFVNYFPCYLFPLLLSGKNTGKKCRDPVFLVVGFGLHFKGRSSVIGFFIVSIAIGLTILLIDK